MNDQYGAGYTCGGQSHAGQSTPGDVSEVVVFFQNQIASISSNNAAELLANVRRVAHQIDAQAEAVSEELAVIEESYPRILSSIRRYKKDLLLTREEVILLRSKYENFVTSFMELIRKHCPTQIPKIQALARKQIMLSRLKWVYRGRELLSVCRALMKESACDWNRLSEHYGSACRHAQENVESADNSHMTFDDGLRALSVDLTEFARRRLKEVLDSIKYPFEDLTDVRVFPNEIAEVVNILSLVCTVAEHSCEGTGYNEMCHALLDPIGTRFAFHFYGDRKTNDIWKPQWYLSQTLNWISANLPFFVSVLDSTINHKSHSKSPTFVFYNYLSELPKVKTRALLTQESVRSNILLFSHLLDECISYETQLRGYLIITDLDADGYSSSILSLFCEKDVLNNWIEIENECCLDRMDEMLSASDRWKNRFHSLEDADQYLVCNCVDAFVSMLQSQHCRAKLLPDNFAQRRFLDLQLLLMDDFRKRLAQIANQAESPWDIPFPNVMNAVWYLNHVVDEWNDSCLLSGIVSSGGRAVFDESSAMFRHVWNQMAEDVVRSLKLQTIDLLKPYQQHAWCVMEPRLGSSSRELTAVFCPILMRIRTAFAKTGSQISKASLEELFKRMSSALAKVFTEEVVDVTPFSPEGASQMLFDIESGLIPVLIHIFTRCEATPNMYYDDAFLTLIGSLKLLSLPWAVITLLNDEIDQLPDEIADEKLFEMKVYGVNKERARRLIRLRIDINKQIDDLVKV